MDIYEAYARYGLQQWQAKMTQEPSLTSQLAKGIQDKMNKFIPDKVNQLITGAIKQMAKGVLVGSEFISGDPLTGVSLEEREKRVRERINTYKKMGAASGAVTGAGGFLLGLADFPVLLSLKMKLLFDIAGLYGFQVRDFQERLYILHIFQLAFCSTEQRIETYRKVLDWNHTLQHLPTHINEFDWHTFQQEYRDYLDIAKILQLVPGIGAIVGAVANHQLVERLGETAMNAYRLRLFDNKQLEAGRQ